MELLIVVLILLWALGFFGGYAAGGLIHVLLIVALVVFILRVIKRQGPLL